MPLPCVWVRLGAFGCILVAQVRSGAFGCILVGSGAFGCIWVHSDRFGAFGCIPAGLALAGAFRCIFGAFWSCRGVWVRLGAWPDRFLTVPVPLLKHGWVGIAQSLPQARVAGGEGAEYVYERTAGAFH